MLVASIFPTRHSESPGPMLFSLLPQELRNASMAAAGAWLRRMAAAEGMPRIPHVLPVLPTHPPPPAPVLEAPALALPACGAAMDLMAVPKKKVSKYKKGLRNGPKALKPVPVIVRCRCCGRVKLPHFYCCSGERGNPDSSSS